MAVSVLYALASASSVLAAAGKPTPGFPPTYSAADAKAQRMGQKGHTITESIRRAAPLQPPARFPLVHPPPLSSHAAACTVAPLMLACDGKTDATTQLQAGLDSCALQGAALALPAGKTCLSFPLVLPSNAILQIPAGAVLKAGPSYLWPNSSSTSAKPFLTAPAGSANITIQVRCGAPATLHQRPSTFWHACRWPSRSIYAEPPAAWRQLHDVPRRFRA